MIESDKKNKKSALSTVSETDSNKYRTLDSHGQTVRRFNPNDERKLTGTGTYNIDSYAQEEEEGDGYSSDEFESYDDESESNNSSILTDGCSGSTADRSATQQIQQAAS